MAVFDEHKRHASALETFNHLVNRLLKGQVGYGNNGSIEGNPTGVSCMIVEGS